MDAEAEPNRHLILYDGICGICDRLCRFVLSHDRRSAFRFAALQSLTGRRILESYGRSPGNLDTFYVVSSYESEKSALLAKSRAALFVLGRLGWPWKLMLIFRLLPFRLLDWSYDRLARRRYKLFGRYDACRVPSPEYRDRFLDTGSL